jgi:hypothetical protein
MYSLFGQYPSPEEMAITRSSQAATGTSTLIFAAVSSRSCEMTSPPCSTAIAEMKIILMAANSGANVLFCMLRRTKCVLLL